VKAVRMAFTAAFAALALAVPAASTPTADAVAFLRARQLESGGFAERGGSASLSLTAWAVLGLRAAGADPGAEARRYVERAEPGTVTELELAIMSRSALGEATGEHVRKLMALRRANGAFGRTVNETIWALLALRQAGRVAPAASVSYLLRQQSRSGGWAWAPGVAPDSNDTAAALQALRAAGIAGKPISRALAFLRRHRNRDGGFALVRGRASDSQSTAWAIQAFVAARAPVPKGAFAFLARLRRVDGSYRYSTRYGATPVWVTAQVLPALARKPFPLERSG
jgi:Prenyltransferase and squalene oxidase repeat